MAISYSEAIRVLKEAGEGLSISFLQTEQWVSLHQAVGRISKYEVLSPTSTPAFDTSAMDGYAVISESTACASVSNPVKLCVKGMMAAGDGLISVSTASEDGLLPCVEIMTGAQFPESTSDTIFDACVRIEDTIPVPGPKKERQYIQIMAPVHRHQNRRFAGNDFQKNDVVLRAKTIVQPHHIMALASLGISQIAVLRKPRIGVLSLGSELCPHDSRKPGQSQIRDVNGPYLTAALQQFGTNVEYLGIIEDDVDVFARALQKKLALENYDVLITSGAVSAGKLDFVREGIEQVAANIQFHKVAVKPGHPILFATLPAHQRETRYHACIAAANSPRIHQTAFFGLPGNPIASAVGLRFFVLPFIRYLNGQPPETPLSVQVRNPETALQNDHLLQNGYSLHNSHTLRNSETLQNGHAIPNGRALHNHHVLHNGLTLPHHAHLYFPKRPNLDIFCHAVLRQGEHELVGIMSSDQGSAKVKPLLGANGWIAIPRGHGVVECGDVLQGFPLLPDRLNNDVPVL